MKKWLKFISVFAVLSFVGVAIAQSTQNYQCVSMSISAAATPVQISPGNFRTAYIKPRAASSVNILAFMNFSNTAPTAVPSACSSPSATFSSATSNCFEVTPTNGTTIGCSSSGCPSIPATLWAIVESAGTDSVDVCTSW